MVDPRFFTAAASESRVMSELQLRRCVVAKASPDVAGKDLIVVRPDGVHLSVQVKVATRRGGSHTGHLVNGSSRHAYRQRYSPRGGADFYVFVSSDLTRFWIARSSDVAHAKTGVAMRAEWEGCWYLIVGEEPAAA